MNTRNDNKLYKRIVRMFIRFASAFIVTYYLSKASPITMFHLQLRMLLMVVSLVLKSLGKQRDFSLTKQFSGKPQVCRCA